MTNKTENQEKENELISSEGSDDDDDDDDVPCIYCNELFSRSWTARDKAWIKCQACQKWAHAACAGVDAHRKTFRCELCC